MKFRVRDGDDNEVTELWLKQDGDNVWLMATAANGRSHHILLIDPSGMPCRPTGVPASTGFVVDDAGKIHIS